MDNHRRRTNRSNQGRLSASAAARQAFKEGRGGRLDDYVVPDEDDVYDILPEDEYEKLVESRRQREDFVVDDDGLGYYDDGEERLGDEDEDADVNGIDRGKRKGASGTANNLSAAALKKARKLRQAAKANGYSQGNDDDDTEANPHKPSMWAFVQRGAAAAAPMQSNTRQNVNIQSVKMQLNSLLDTLDEVNTNKRRRISRPPPSSHPSKHSHDPQTTTPLVKQIRGRKAQRRGSLTLPLQHDIEDDDINNNDDTVGVTWDDAPDDDAVPTNDDPHSIRVNEATTMESIQNDSKPVPLEDKDSIEESSTFKPAARRRLGRPKLGTVSAPMREATQATSAPTPAPQPDNTPDKLLTTATLALDTSSASFCPDHIAAEPQAPPQASSNLESALLSDEKGVKYIDMFWIDACEVNGDILLFGKVPVGDSTFVSCCAKVRGNKRNLFCLPRKNDSGEYVSMMDVHNEMKSILQPSCIPIKEGASWAGKVVSRQYAFEDQTLPREMTQYLKVVYDAEWPMPESQVCESGGKSIARILGAGASVLENFIIKRNLMGPGWIRIQDPGANPTASSWCKLELLVTSPKQVTRLQLETPRPPPPVVTVSMKLKTIVNPRTHKSEIVSVSAICHRQVLLDTASDESRVFMKQLSLIRPLGTAANENSLPQFPRDFDVVLMKNMKELCRMPNERALLSRLLAQLGTWDPDVIVGHNAWGYDMQVLLGRCIDLKVSMWSKIGRRRRMGVPHRKDHFSTDWAIMEALQGRLLCDTYLSAKELLRETTYSLTHLAAAQLKVQRTEIEPVDIPLWYNESQSIVKLAKHTLFDAQLVQRLMFKLQILPLTKQLTCVAGNMWSRTIKGNRADRTEYLLLHEFHSLKFIPPEKRRIKKEKTAVSEKAKYSGGLVLEPKKGYYDSFILLLDFNSLYPSIIQEYNLCFTTMNWSNYIGGGDNGLPPVPDESLACGVLPRVIKTLVERRRAVKKMMKSEQNPDKKEELNIRQTALKLTANSMYGCLGFSNSRFFAQPIAALVTAMGRETLQRTVDIAINSVGLDVIYGDTDSIMINTRISDPADFNRVLQLGEKVKHEVNKLYKTLELEVDGTFRSLLLLKKKKYAAVTADIGPDGTLHFGKETKGLDLVRRDWCIQSKDTGRFVLDQILSGEDKELVVKNIHDHLEALAETMRKGELPLDKYVITKGLSKHPNEYPDGKSQPHVHVAKQMLQNNRPVNTGDHIPYIICDPLEEQKDMNLSPVERARHPEEVRRSGGLLQPDVEWYLTQQILPPTSRLCEPIEGTSQSILAVKLGLDAKKYHQILHARAEIDDEELVDYTPASSLPDEERFKEVEKLKIRCSSCCLASEFPGVFSSTSDGILIPGLRCTNADCQNPQFWGQTSHFECLAKISNAVQQLLRSKMQEYYAGVAQCDDPICGLRTRQVSVACTCLARGCTGRMHAVVTERTLYTQLKYMDSLFDISHATKQYSRVPKMELLKTIGKHEKICFEELHKLTRGFLKQSAYNWIEPSLWRSLFAAGSSTQ